MGLGEELGEIAQAVWAHADEGEQVAAVIPTQLQGDGRVYLCAFESQRGRSWLLLDAEGSAIADRTVVRDAATVAALCELAEETAGGGNLADLSRRLAELREIEGPEGIEEAVEALAALESTIEAAPRLASTEYLDRIGGATRRLEQALGEIGASPFAEAMKHGAGVVARLAADVEQSYKPPPKR